MQIRSLFLPRLKPFGCPHCLSKKSRVFSRPLSRIPDTTNSSFLLMCHFPYHASAILSHYSVFKLAKLFHATNSQFPLPKMPFVLLCTQRNCYCAPKVWILPNLSPSSAPLPSHYPSSSPHRPSLFLCLLHSTYLSCYPKQFIILIYLHVYLLLLVWKLPESRNQVRYVSISLIPSTGHGIYRKCSMNNWPGIFYF